MPEQSSPASTANGQRPDASFGELVKDATEQLSTLIRAEVELAKLEVLGSVKRAGLGAAMFGAAGFVLILSIPFLFVALAEGLVEIFGGWRWAAYLIVFGLFALVAALLVFIGIRLMKKIKKPERTISTVKELPQVLKHGESAPAIEAGGERESA